MYYIEEGKDLNGNPVWFVLRDADLIEAFGSEEEAKTYIESLN